MINAHDVDVFTVGCAASDHPRVPPNRCATNEPSLKSTTKRTNVPIRCTYEGLFERQERAWRKGNVSCSTFQIQMREKNRMKTSHECFFVFFVGPSGNEQGQGGSMRPR
mmetsp:Transcript_1742/g.10745  ORF Transcript_1742/g.10745 Transcript_1742/m.10745 type:complete len:109 (+) Transcript_1742:1818-2144(+)